MELQKVLGLLLSLFVSISGMAQSGDLGWENQPNDGLAIDPPGYYGEYGDFSGGYQVGDIVADFTVYDFYGNPITLSEELDGGKPVIIINGSVTCDRFHDVFDPSVQDPAYNTTREFMYDYADEFNWIVIYNMEAHPTDGNCPSNCPPALTSDTTLIQHPDYHYRRYALWNWMNAPELSFPFEIYADNPDNAVFNNFFERPFGGVVLSCEGEVLYRGDWWHTWMRYNSNSLLELLEEPWQTCLNEENPDGEGEGQGEGEGEGEGEGNGEGEGEGEGNGGASGYGPFGFDLTQNGNIQIYPNPASHDFTIKELDKVTVIKIFNAFGQLIQEETVSRAQMTVDCSLWPAGHYFVIAMNGEEVVGRTRVARVN